MDRFSERVVPALPTLRSQVIHNDLTLDNLRRLCEFYARLVATTAGN